MKRGQKFVFFVVAVVTMALFAGASIIMAQNQTHWRYGLLLMLLAFVVTGFGFVLRRKLLNATRHDSPNP